MFDWLFEEMRTSFALPILVVLSCWWVSGTSSGVKSLVTQKVAVFHFVLRNWGRFGEDFHPCGPVSCLWVRSDNISTLAASLSLQTAQQAATVGLYNIHSLSDSRKVTGPLRCELPTMLTMAETAEAFTRYQSLHEAAAKNFDGSSTVAHNATVQRVYDEAFLRKADLLPRAPFPSMIKAGAFVASACHRGQSEREQIVLRMRALGLRVDGLGRCLHTESPENVTVSRRRGNKNYLEDKRPVIGRFLFTMAFENTVEPGYVTEKAFDALIGGTRPAIVCRCVGRPCLTSAVVVCCLCLRAA